MAATAAGTRRAYRSSLLVSGAAVVPAAAQGFRIFIP